MRASRRHIPHLEGLESRATPTKFGSLPSVTLLDAMSTLAVEGVSLSLQSPASEKTTTGEEMPEGEMAEKSGMSMPMWGMPPMDDGVMTPDTTLESPPLFPNLARFSMKRSSLGRMTIPMRRGTVETGMNTDMSSRMSVPQAGLDASQHSEIRIRSSRRDDIDAALMEMYGTPDEEGKNPEKTEGSSAEAPNEKQKRDEPSSDPNAEILTVPLEIPLKPELSVPLAPQNPDSGGKSPPMNAPKVSLLKSTPEQPRYPQADLTSQGTAEEFLASCVTLMRNMVGFLWPSRLRFYS